MNDYFEREILAVERELTRLKTAAQRSSGTVVTTKASKEINIELHNTSAGCRGEADYVITMSKDCLVNITLDWYFEDVTKEWQPFRTSRSMSYHKSILPDGKIGVHIIARGTDYSTDGSDDESRVARGETIVLTTTMTVLATNNISIEEYNG